MLTHIICKKLLGVLLFIQWKQQFKIINWATYLCSVANIICKKIDVIKNHCTRSHLLQDSDLNLHNLKNFKSSVVTFNLVIFFTLFVDFFLNVLLYFYTCSLVHVLYIWMLLILPVVTIVVSYTPIFPLSAVVCTCLFRMLTSTLKWIELLIQNHNRCFVVFIMHTEIISD